MKTDRHKRLNGCPVTISSSKTLLSRTVTSAVFLAVGACLPIVQAADIISTWNNSTGNWSDPTRWNSNPLYPTNGNGGFAYAAIVNGGTATLDQAIVLESLSQGGGLITGSFPLTLTGNSTFNGAWMAGTGTTTISEGGTLSLSNSTLERPLVNYGSATWEGSNVFNMHNGTFTNNGNFTAIAGLGQTLDSYGYSSGGINAFNNSATFVKQGPGTARFRRSSSDVVFNNDGVVSIQAGTVQLESGGSHTGDFQIADGASLHLGYLGSAHALAVGSDVTGAGSLFVGGNSTLNGVVNIGGTLTARDAAFNGAVTAPSLSVSFGTGTFNGALNAPGGTITSGTFAGSANWTITSSLAVVSGVIAESGMMTIAPGRH
jgi:hypothetical protein